MHTQPEHEVGKSVHASGEERSNERMYRRGTWNRCPSGEKTVIARSYDMAVGEEG
jgi:hypothetical protein